MQDLEQLRERVRADRRTVTAPLVVFGGLVLLRTVLAVLAGLAGPAAEHSVVLLYWPVAGAVGLFVLWGYSRRIAVRDGVGEGPRSYRPVTIGYLVSLPLLALLFLPAFFVGIWASLFWPAAILTAVGVRQHSRTLKSAAQWLAAGGAAQLLLVLVGVAVGSVSEWLALGVEPVAGLAMLTAAVLLTRRARPV